MSSRHASSDDQALLLRRSRAWNATMAPYPRTVPLTDLFRAQARRAGTRPAVTWDDGQLSYLELLDRAETLARVLVAAGVGAGHIVILAVPRSANGLIGLWAILLAGGAYLPLDPGYPPARIEAIVRESGARHAIVDPVHAVALPAGIEGTAVDARLIRGRREADVAIDASTPAYVIYTSGSTGVPRGVMVTHRGPVRLVRGATWLALTSDDTLLATTSLTFDVSTFEIFGALLNGARLVLPSTEVLLSPRDLEERLVRERVSVMWLSAGLFHQTAAMRPDLFRRLRCFLAGGDALNPASVRAVLAAGKPDRFLNGYGPTENACFSTTYEIDALDPDATTVPIGRPIQNSTAWVVRSDGTLAAAGEEGELWVGGDGVALGYHRRPDLTAAQFVPDAFGTTPSARLYRTGDMARWRPDGVIEFLGRRDRQVKVRGFRVELREIEHVLMAEPSVRAAAVLLDADGPHAGSLRAWAVTDIAPGADMQSHGARLRRHLSDRLPGYMVPATVHVVDRLPLNSQGKVDRSAVALSVVPSRPIVDPPRTDTERAVARIWQTLLAAPAVDRNDSFFMLGGQSLHATQVASAVRSRLNLPSTTSRVLIRTLLEQPSLANYALTIDRLRTATALVQTGERYSPIDFNAEARLDPDLAFGGPPAGDPYAPASVLLTGASGFLGVYVLDRLARAGVAEITCLVRTTDDRVAIDRLAGRMRRFGLDVGTVARVIRPLAGDLSLPRFGLSAARFAALAERIDVIVHAGSHVNFAYPYEALRAANVGGTATVLRLAAAPTVKPVHYVSTIAVIAGCGVSNIRFVTEDEPLRHPDRICLGYPESKWVAEQMVREAAQRGLPVTIYRPYEITGTRDRGIWNTDTMMCALFRTIAETGLSPDMPLPLDFVPVDFTAEAIVHILRTQRPTGRVHHVTNPHDARLPLLDERLRAMGYPVQTIAYHAWVDHLADLTAAEPRHPMAPYLPMFAERAGDRAFTVKEMYFAGTFPAFSRANFAAATAGAALDCPPVDAEMLDLYLRYFVESGFMRPPGASR